ncbi:MAG: hypothetical protein AAF806_23035, partial [Bacteroidota bacterium]
SYTIEGNQISIKNNAKGSPCEGLLMIYEFQLDQVPNTIKVIEEQCSAGKRTGIEWQITKVNTPLIAKKL